MSHRMSISLPDHLHHEVLAAARRDRMSASAWVCARLARSFATPDVRALRDHLTERERKRLLERALRLKAT